MLKTYQKKYPNVNFLGAIKDKEQLAYWYRSAAIHVFPSLLDTYGLVNLEAMSCGTPVVGYDVPGSRDVIIPGVNGDIAWNGDLFDAVYRALQLSRVQVSESVKDKTWEACTKSFLSYIVDKE